MSKIDRAFTVPGLSIDDEVGVFYGIEDRTSSGFDVPKGSLYLNKPESGTVKIFQKYGDGDYDWRDLNTANIKFSDAHEPTGFVNRTDSNISFVNGTRTFTIQPAVSSFDFYVDGSEKITKSGAENKVISDTERYVPQGLII